MIEFIVDHLTIVVAVLCTICYLSGLICGLVIATPTGDK